MGKKDIPDYFTDLKEMENKLLTNIKTKLPELEMLLREASSHWCYEDPIYRFYHHSLKVYSLQYLTRRIVDVLKDLRRKASHYVRNLRKSSKRALVERNLNKNTTKNGHIIHGHLLRHFSTPNIF